MKRKVIVTVFIVLVMIFSHYYNKMEEVMVYNDNQQFSIFGVDKDENGGFSIASIQRKNSKNIVVKLAGIDKSKINKVEWQSDNGVWNTVKSSDSDKLTYTITPGENVYICAVKATSTDGREVVRKGPTIESVERINTRNDSTVIKLVARDNIGKGIWAAYYYDDKGNRIIKLNELLMNPEKEIMKRTNENFSEYAKNANKVVVISENGLASVKNVVNKEIKDLTFKIKSVERKGQYVDVQCSISDGITLKEVKFYMSDGSIVEKTDIPIKEVDGSEVDKIIEKLEFGENSDIIPKKVEFIAWYDYVFEKELIVAYDMLQVKNISTVSDNVVIEVNNPNELDSITYYYKDTSESLTDINNKKIVIDKKNELKRFTLHGVAGNTIDYYGANISSAKKIDSDGGKFIVEMSEFSGGISNDKIQVINLYDEDDNIIKFDEPLISKAKVDGKKVLLDVVIDDKVRKADKIRIFTANGMVTEKKIDDMTAFGNRIEVKEIIALDSKTLSVEIKDTFYVNNIEQVKIQRTDGREDILTQTKQGDRLVNVDIEEGVEYSKIAVVNQRGEMSNWYELLQIGNIEPTDTGLRINVKKSIFGLKEVVWFYQDGEFRTKEISGYGPLSIDIEGKNNEKESIMMVYVKDNIGVRLEYKAPNIEKAEKVEAGGGRLNINIKKNNDSDIDKVILYDRESKILKTYNSINNLKMSYVLDDEIRACKRVKVVSKNGLVREADIVQIDPKIISIELLKKDKGIKVVISRTIENGIKNLEWKSALDNEFKGKVKIDKSGVAVIPSNRNVEKIRVCYDNKILEYGVAIERADKLNVSGTGLWNKIKSIFGWDKKGELVIKASISDTKLDDTFDKIEIYVNNGWVKLKSLRKNTKEIDDQVFNITSKNIGFKKVRIYTKKGFVVESIIKVR